MRLTNAVLLTTILAMASCSKKQEALPYVAHIDSTDSTALQVAVLPTVSCLPVHYALRMGMFHQAGIKVRLWRYQAQMDVDTSIVQGHVCLAISDPFHAIRLQSDSLSVSPLIAVREPLSLMALKGRRVKRMQQMKEKTVAVNRLSSADYWCQRMVEDAHLDLSTIFRPQVNDLYLRTDMLLNGFIDAAILPEPYATWAALEGHKRISTTPKQGISNALWIVTRKRGESNDVEAQAKTFARVYEEAVREMSENPQADTLRAILVNEYRMPPLLTDTIQLPQIPAPHPITTDEIETAAQWLRTQNRLPKNHKTQEFLLQQIK
ncbi:MAG: ABC transporter substrate-binding protein [Bacteroidaceae bacterium]